MAIPANQIYQKIANKHLTPTTQIKQKITPEPLTSAKTSPSPVDRLPDELMLKIFSLLSPTDIAKTGLVCNRFWQISQDQSIWSFLLKRDFRDLKPREQPKDHYQQHHRIRTNLLNANYTTTTLQGHTNWIECLQLKKGKLISGSWDNTIKIWNPIAGQCERTLEGHKAPIWSLLVTNEGKLISGSFDKTIKIWDLISGQCERTLEGHQDFIRSLLLTNEGKLISSSSDSTIKIWDPINGKCERTLKGHSRAITFVMFKKGKLISASEEGVIKIWDFNGATQK